MTIHGSNRGSRNKSNQMASYFVQMREFERRLIREAYAATDDIVGAADALGVHVQYVKARAKLLGGVFGDEPKHEPPGPAAEAWNKTSTSGQSRQRAKRTVKPVEEPTT